MIAEEMEAEQLLYLGRFYLRTPHRRIDACKRYLNRVLSEYPGTTSALYSQELMVLIDPPDEDTED